jgi:hypothetical protein
MMGISARKNAKRPSRPFKNSIWAYTRKDKKSIKEDIEKFTLYPILRERRNQLAGTLSGGEQQMLARPGHHVETQAPIAHSLPSPGPPSG